MITLCGIPLSNYYSKVKLALLEKGLAFNEEHVATGRTDEQTLSASPLAKVPFIRTAQGALCESQAIIEYVQALQPSPSLLPDDPFEAAKVRELIVFIELHLELVVRELYGQAFFGGSASDSTQARVRKTLGRTIPAFKRLAKFSPFVAGASFTMADCSAYAHLPVIGAATRNVLGEDLLAAAGIDWKSYARRIAERPSAQRVDADRKASLPPRPPR